ncbi:hypothetical protein XI06_07010 [Bradyrhizobium sp. CCBAU 11434]|nr:hypothetical protein [Bradyrhizobium sp. CCBAU 11434]
MAFDKTSQPSRNIMTAGSDVLLNVARNVLRCITRPALDWIEGHHPEGLVILACQQILDQRGVVDPFVGLAESGTIAYSSRTR